MDEQPHAAHEREAEDGSEQRSDESDEVVEEGNDLKNGEQIK